MGFIPSMSTTPLPIVVTEVPAGDTAILKCPSNDNHHNFLFWQLNQDQIIGPGNTYDPVKYKYEVLSGKLFIKAVSPNESGQYKCVSKNIDDSGLTVGSIKMIVKGAGTISSDDSSFETIKLVCIILSIVIIICCAILYYKLRKDWSIYEGKIVRTADDGEEDGEVIYNPTTTSINPAVPGPSRNPSSDHLFGIDNQGLDTDFNSVFEQININAQKRSLI